MSQLEAYLFAGGMFVLVLGTLVPLLWQLTKPKE